MTEQEMQFELMKSQEKVNELRQEVASMNKEREYWQQVRIQAAIAAMQTVDDHVSTVEELAKRCVRYADALVAELKKGEGYANIQQ